MSSDTRRKRKSIEERVNGCVCAMYTKRSDGRDLENGSLKCTTAGASLRWLKKSKFLTTTVVKVFIYLLFIILILPILIFFLTLEINIDGGRTNWRFRPCVNDGVAIEACVDGGRTNWRFRPWVNDDVAIEASDL